MHNEKERKKQMIPNKKRPTANVGWITGMGPERRHATHMGRKTNERNFSRFARNKGYTPCQNGIKGYAKIPC